MFQAPDLVCACPHCGAPARVSQSASGNPFGAVTWTDGWLDAPEMPRIPRMTQCGSCDKAWWIAEAPQLGLHFHEADAAENKESESKPDWSTAPLVKEMDSAQCLAAIENGLGYTRDLETELRMFAWWRSNDAMRKGAPSEEISEKHRENIERLLELLTETDEESSLFRTEMYRHLGRFEEARQELGHVFCSDWRPARERFEQLLEQGSRKVEVLFMPLPPEEVEGILAQQKAGMDWELIPEDPAKEGA